MSRKVGVVLVIEVPDEMTDRAATTAVYKRIANVEGLEHSTIRTYDDEYGNPVFYIP